MALGVTLTGIIPRQLTDALWRARLLRGTSFGLEMKVAGLAKKKGLARCKSNFLLSVVIDADLSLAKSNLPLFDV